MIPASALATLNAYLGKMEMETAKRPVKTVRAITEPSSISNTGKTLSHAHKMDLLQDRLFTRVRTV